MNTHRHDSGSSRPIWIGATMLAIGTGALLATACDARETSVGAGETSVGAAIAAGTAENQTPEIQSELADLDQQFTAADRAAKREIEQANANSENMPVALRERLAAAIERTQDARGEASERLEELKNSGGSHWASRRARVVEALGELEEARHEVVAALAGGEPSLSDG